MKVSSGKAVQEYDGWELSNIKSYIILILFSLNDHNRIIIWKLLLVLLHWQKEIKNVAKKTKPLTDH
jgi:hypothetical protein